MAAAAGREAQRGESLGAGRADGRPSGRDGRPAGGGPVPGLSASGAGGGAAGGRRGARRRSRPGPGLRRSRSAPTRSRSARPSTACWHAEGWALAAATGSVFGRWAQIVGADLAAHTTPESLSDGELTVSADSTAWATQVRLLAAQLVRRLNSELGDGTVLRVKVRGPVTSTQEARRMAGPRRPGPARHVRLTLQPAYGEAGARTAEASGVSR